MSDTPQPLPAVRANDPDSAGVEADNTPPPGQPKTEDPHRITLVVPVPDETVFSLGMGAPTRIKDTGITGRTKTHVHFHTQEPETTQTMIALGGPTQEGFANEGAPNNLANNAGFMAVTSGFCWTESFNSWFGMSLEGDTTLQTKGEGKSLGLSADNGKVLVFGKETVTLGSPKAIKIVSHPDVKVDALGYEPSGFKGWTEGMVDNYGAKIASTIATLGELVTSAVAFYSSISPTQNKGLEGEAGWKPEQIASLAKVFVDLKLFESGFIRGAMELAGAEAAGSVGISGQKFVSINAGIGAGMFGSLTASVTSLTQASLLGGVSATVKGLAWTEIAGSLLTAVTALKNVEVTASKGELEMTAKKEVSLSSQTEAILITAAKAAQMSADGEVFLFGAKGAYLGAGGSKKPEEGFGIQIEPTALKLGEAASATNFKDPGIVAKNQIELKKGLIELTVESTQIEMKPDEFSLTAKELKLQVGSGAAIHITTSDKILLG